MPRQAIRVLCSALVLLVLSACGAKDRPDDMDMYKTDLPVMMPIPYTPRDDGKPLTAGELRAFKTVGPLDRHLSAEEARIVELHFKDFVHNSRDLIQRFIDRSARFLPYIKQTFKARGIPEDIAYLCMVESGGNPNARSHAGAVGLWQFMPATGRAYGLRQNNWIDERRDPFKATLAASDYLLKLYNDFSEWHLAIAAYNAGEGKIGRAVGGTGAGNFFELCRLDNRLEERARLRPETREYVPRLLAMTKIMRDPRLLGFRPPEPHMAWNLKPMQVPPGVNLAGLARHLDLTWDEFSGMNPAYRKTASPPNDHSTAYLPPPRVTAALGWITTPEARIFAGMKEYAIRKGDTLASVARRHKVTEEALRQANGFAALPARGAVILIPAGGRSVEPVYEALPQAATAPAASAGAYRVREGDTLSSLAALWGTDVASIRLANRMGKNETLKPGERVSIPGNARNPRAVPRTRSGMAPEKPSGKEAFHTVQRGDTVGAIARQHGISFGALCDANNLDRENPLIRPGQRLTLPFKGAAPEKSRPATAQTAEQTIKAGPYKVRSGDTLYGIARAAGVRVADLCAANQLERDATLRPGQKLVIPGAGAPEKASGKLPEKSADKLPDKGGQKKDAREAARKDGPGKDGKDAAKAGAKPRAEKADKGPAPSGSKVTVKEGDTLYGIARANSVSVEALQRANNLGSSTRVRVGQKLVIP